MKSNKKYCWCSTNTGELAHNFVEVVKLTIETLRYYHFLELWKYKKEGF